MHETVQIARLRAMAARHGWRWIGEPTTGFCGSLEIGHRTLQVIGADIGLNSSGAARIAGDKAFTHFFLTRAGLPVIPTRLLRSPEEAGSVSALPILFKPNGGHGGAGIAVAERRESLLPAYRLAREVSPLVLAQPYLRQRDFRVIVFNRRPLLAYERKPLRLTGDGRRPLRELLEGRFWDDPRCHFNLQQAGLDLDSVLHTGRTLEPIRVANLKAGASWRACLGELSPALLSASVAAAGSLGLILAGVDLFAASPDAGTFVINEVNASPGLQVLASEPALLDPLFHAIEAYLSRADFLD